MSDSMIEGPEVRIGTETSQGTSHLFTSDAVLTDDPGGRVACETLLTTGLVIVAGEITTETYVDIPNLVRGKLQEIGYTRAKFGFDYETCGVMVAIDPQSADIAQGVDEDFETYGEEALNEIGAGDQGM